MNPRLVQTLLVASLGVFAVAANADDATPRNAPTGGSTINTNKPTGDHPTTTTAAPSGTMASPSGMAYKPLSDTDIRAYRDARTACERLTGAAQTSCNTQLASTWSQVDPKCQKLALSGTALDSCLKGSDHAGQ